MTTVEAGDVAGASLGDYRRDLIFCDKFAEPSGVAGLLERWRDEGARPVCAFGSFEFLAVESARIAAGAARGGGKLLIGVFDDESVERMKGGGRPVMSLSRRLDMAAALEAAGAVTVVSLDGMEEFLERVRPFAEVVDGAGGAAGDICSDALINLIKEKYVTE